MGLSISGGGIRSATFSTGVMQALAKHGVMQRVDYLSTVSGGGYIGASLTWLLNKYGRRPGDEDNPDRRRFSCRRDEFPFGIRSRESDGNEHTLPGG